MEEFIGKMEDFSFKKDRKNILLDKGVTKFKFNIGSKKGIRTSTFVGIISNIPGIKAEDIGIISIMDTMSYLEILNGKGDLVAEAMKKIKVKGKLLKVRKII